MIELHKAAWASGPRSTRLGAALLDEGKRLILQHVTEEMVTATMCDLSVQQVQAVHKCHLDKCGIVQVPPPCWSMLDLTDLGLWNNGICELSPEIGLLTNLRNLSMPQNALTHLPASIGRLFNLERLDCCMNQLCMLPRTLRRLTKLSTLGLESNQALKQFARNSWGLKSTQTLLSEIHQVFGEPSYKAARLVLGMWRRGAGVWSVQSQASVQLICKWILALDPPVVANEFGFDAPAVDFGSLFDAPQVQFNWFSQPE